MPSFFPPPGPSLPEFTTLLVRGAYHPSAPVHLIASHISRSENNYGVLVTPSRAKIQKALIEHNDDWLANNALLGRVAPIFSRVSVFYPPTPAHVSMLLSVLRTSNMPQPPVSMEIKRNTMLITAPSLVVLHEPSSYFIPRGIYDDNAWTVSSYLTLVLRFFGWLDVIQKASDTPYRPISFALFDSELGNLKLPLMNAPFGGYDINDEDPRASSNEDVSVLVEKFFECIATFREDSAEVPSSQDEEPISDQPNWKHMALFRRDRPDELENFRWLELPVPEVENQGKVKTTFIFDQT